MTTIYISRSKVFKVAHAGCRYYKLTGQKYDFSNMLALCWLHAKIALNDLEYIDLCFLSKKETKLNF